MNHNRIESLICHKKSMDYMQLMLPHRFVIAAAFFRFVVVGNLMNLIFEVVTTNFLSFNSFNWWFIDDTVTLNALFFLSISIQILWRKNEIFFSSLFLVQCLRAFHFDITNTYFAFSIINQSQINLSIKYANIHYFCVFFHSIQ